VLYIMCKKYEAPYVIGPVVIYHSALMFASMHISLACCVHSASTHLKQTSFFFFLKEASRCACNVI